MKSVVHKLIIVILLGLIHFQCFSQTIIQMEEYGGVYRIPCKVNGAKMKLIFDTGADKVCLSLSMAEYLFDNDFISKNDIKGSGSSTVADGSIVDHIKINIKDIEIQGIHLKNVEAVVIDGQNAPLLLGQSAIQKLGTLEINGSVLIIKNGDNSNDEAYINRLFEEAKQAYDNNMYSRAVEKYDQLYALDKLSEYGIYKYVWSCYMNEDIEKAEEIVGSIKDYAWYEEKKVDIYRLTGHILMARERFLDAANFFELSSRKIYTSVNDETDQIEIFNNLKYMGDCYYYAGIDGEAAKNYGLAVGMYAVFIHHVDIPYIIRDCKNRLKKKELSYRNDDIDYVVYQWFLCRESSGELSSMDFMFHLTALARARNKYAMKMCNKMALDPYDDIWY